MATWALTASVGVASLLQLAAGCAFSGKGLPLPLHHVRLPTQTGGVTPVIMGDVAPDNHPVDLAGGLFIIPGGGITVPRPGYGTNVSGDVLLDVCHPGRHSSCLVPLHARTRVTALPPPKRPREGEPRSVACGVVADSNVPSLYFAVFCRRCRCRHGSGEHSALRASPNAPLASICRKAEPVGGILLYARLLLTVIAMRLSNPCLNADYSGRHRHHGAAERGGGVGPAVLLVVAVAAAAAGCESQPGVGPAREV